MLFTTLANGGLSRILSDDTGPDNYSQRVTYSIGLDDYTDELLPSMIDLLQRVSDSLSLSLWYCHSSGCGPTLACGYAGSPEHALWVRRSLKTLLVPD